MQVKVKVKVEVEVEVEFLTGRGESMDLEKLTKTEEEKSHFTDS